MSENEKAPPPRNVTAVYIADEIGRHREKLKGVIERVQPLTKDHHGPVLAKVARRLMETGEVIDELAGTFQLYLRSQGK